MNFINFLMISFIMTFILMTLSLKISKELVESENSSSNFECGFQSQAEKNIQLSSQFFMIAIIFLIFDVEIALILPVPLNSSFILSVNWNMILILILLFIGTILEWKMGIIEWTK